MQRIEPPYRITMHAGKANQARDPDNYWKATLDALVTGKVLDGDSWKYVNGLTINKAFGIVPEGFVDIEID
jgi:Holliday junction resolvase RusA-like endonuclease